MICMQGSSYTRKTLSRHFNSSTKRAFFPLSLNSFANSLHNIGAAWSVSESPRAEHDVLMLNPLPNTALLPSRPWLRRWRWHRELSVPEFYSEAPPALTWVLPGILSCISSFPDVSSFANFSCDSSFSLCNPDAKCEYPFPLTAQSLAWRVVPPACLIKRKNLKSPPCSSLQSCCACQ